MSTTIAPCRAQSPARGRTIVAVPALEAAKLALHDAMLTAKVSNVDLAHRLGIDEKAVRRLRDPLHRSRIEAVEEALHALGRQLEIAVAPRRRVASRHALAQGFCPQ